MVYRIFLQFVVLKYTRALSLFRFLDWTIRFLSIPDTTTIGPLKSQMRSLKLTVHLAVITSCSTARVLSLWNFTLIEQRVKYCTFRSSRGPIPPPCSPMCPGALAAPCFSSALTASTTRIRLYLHSIR